mgnify:CR=1 FL=1
MQKQNIVILGATGSIGQSTLSVIEHNPDKYRAFALVGGKNAEAMLEKCIKFRPHFVNFSGSMKTSSAHIRKDAVRHCV